MKRFTFSHKRGVEKGFVFGLVFRSYGYFMWIGYGKPVWWKPKLLCELEGGVSFGVGWLLLCFQVLIVKVG